MLVLASEKRFFFQSSRYRLICTAVMFREWIDVCSVGDIGCLPTTGLINFLSTVEGLVLPVKFAINIILRQAN